MAASPSSSRLNGRERGKVCLGRDIKWSEEEDGNTKMQVITSPLLSFAIASIHHSNHIFYFGGMDLRKVAEDSLYDHSSLTQSSHLPPLFNSAFACMCILCKSHLSNGCGNSVNSVGQSSANPTYQMAAGTAWEVSYQAPKDVGVKASGTATSTMNFNAWKFEQSARGMQGTFKWVLCDSSDSNGGEVISSKPSKSKSGWYRDRYRKACSPFTGEGGVVFASDDYGKSFTWTLNESGNAERMKVRIEGSIWVTYWPNLHKTSFYESRYHEFSKLVELPLQPINSK